MRPDTRTIVLIALGVFITLLAIQVVKATFWPTPEQVIYVVPSRS
jgi:hypothetical protein